MNLNDRLNGYNIEIAPLAEGDGGGFEAFYSQLGRSAVGYGETVVEAAQDLLEVAKLFLASLEEDGLTLEPATVPQPWQEMSGRVTLRVSKSLHYRLDKLADAEGVSLNSFMTDLLQSGVTALESGHLFGAVLATPQSVPQDTKRLRAV